MLEAPINNENISSILHAITTEFGNDTIRFLMVAVGKLGQVKEDDLNDISWHMIAWGGAIDHIQVVNGLRAIKPDGDFTALLGIKDGQRVTLNNIVLAGYIKRGVDGDDNRLGIRFSSTSLETAYYPINADSWIQKFVDYFPDVNIIEALV